MPDTVPTELRCHTAGEPHLARIWDCGKEVMLEVVVSTELRFTRR
jgi:hypothetical protein